MTTSRRFDVAILGGGPAGAAAAVTLAASGASALVVERSDGGGREIGESIPPIARPLIEALGLDSELETGDHLASYGNRSAWGSAKHSFTDFLFHPEGRGWHLDRVAFNRALLRRARAVGAYVALRTRVVANCYSERGGWALELESYGCVENVSARVVLDCTGRPAAFARTHGARRLVHDRLVAIAWTIEGGAEAVDLDTTTTVESTPYGWWYTARLPLRRRIVVFLTDSDLGEVSRAVRCDEAILMLEPTGCIRRCLSSYRLSGALPPRVMPANSSRSDMIAGPDWMAVGDAAATYDPLSSQGIMIALAAGRRAAHAARARLEGDVTAVARYAEEIADVYEEYLRNRSIYYSTETRWPDALFWKRRISPR